MALINSSWFGGQFFFLNNEMSVHYDQFLPLAKTQWRWIKGAVINRLQLFATVSDMSGLSPWRIQKNFHSSFKITEDRTSTYGININKQNQLDRLNWKVAFLYCLEHTLIDFPLISSHGGITDIILRLFYCWCEVCYIIHWRPDRSSQHYISLQMQNLLKRSCSFV